MTTHNKHFMVTRTMQILSDNIIFNSVFGGFISATNRNKVAQLALAASQ